MHPHPFLLPAFKGVVFDPCENLAPFIEGPFFGIAKLVATHRANELVSLTQLSLFIDEGSEKFVRLFLF